MPFEHLIPDEIINAVESATGFSMTGLTVMLPSYINRVYELMSQDGMKLIAKFYRPGRWTVDAVTDEHTFLIDCAEAELPVITPYKLKNGRTIWKHNDILLAVFPKRGGRQLEITEDSSWYRLGSLIARLHIVGEKKEALHRIIISPEKSAQDDINYLCGNIIPSQYRQAYHDTAQKIIDISAGLFRHIKPIRIHGDCHRGNILDRMDEGLFLIDFDDMAMGPPVQDLWLLLPDRADASKNEIEMFIEGYERFRIFDRTMLKCIEPLRAMRMIYFLSWCSRQVNDAGFSGHFHEWGKDSFWQHEINDLREQLGFIFDSMNS